MASTYPDGPALDVDSIASIASIASHQGNTVIAVNQTRHRVDLVQFWDIRPGEKVLELGCGQGDCTVVLASAVGERGHVTAVDPGALDYGSPMTLGEAQAHIKASPLGARITFVQADPRTHLHSILSSAPLVDGFFYDTAILSHCIWYFASPGVLRETLALLFRTARRVCIAEYALTAMRANATPHLLAVLAQAGLEACRPVGTSKSNVRTVLSPARIEALVLDAAAQSQSEAPNKGWKLVRAWTKAPLPELEDGRWEVGAVRAASFAQEVDALVREERELAVVHAYMDAVLAGFEAVKACGEKIETMDVWAAVFDRGD
ncbi:hypothetical protein M0805_003662 [Coniferiporia weirii]|nr:hypothetical protein M0805_003662 [Coniferiporia weirii]